MNLCAASSAHAGQWAHVVFCRAPCAVCHGDAEPSMVSWMPSSRFAVVDHLFFTMLQCCHAAISPAIPNHGISPSTPGAPPWPVQTPLNALTHTLNSPRFALGSLPGGHPLPSTRTDYIDMGGLVSPVRGRRDHGTISCQRGTRLDGQLSARCVQTLSFLCVCLCLNTLGHLFMFP